MAKRKKAAKKRRMGAGLLVKMLILTLLAAAGLKLYDLRDQVEQARLERERVAAQVEVQRQKNDAMSADIEEGCTPEKMQEIARRELGWVGPGEIVFDSSS